MVGVPGRSKGCHTCRRRKKKCDLERPFCGNCTRGKFICAGYDRDMIIVQVNQQGKGTYQQQPPKTATQPWTPNTVHTSPADVRLRDLNRTAFEMECIAWLRFLLSPSSSVNHSGVRMNTAPSFVENWWSQIYHQAPRSDLIRCSVLSVGAFQVGHATRDCTLRNRGVELYSEAIRIMSRALAPSELSRGTSVMLDLEMAGYALAIYEYLRQETPHFEEQELPAARFRKYYDRDEIRFSYRQKGHMAGIMNLMQYQDPRSYAEPSRHQIFVQLRQFWIPLCIESRTGTFLATKEWLKKPWQGLHKSYYDTMWDTVAPIPSLLEAWDSLKSATAIQGLDERILKLKASCYDIEAGFEKWHHDLATACPSFTLEEASALRTLIDTIALEDLPEALITHGPWYLFSWMMHWAARIVLYCTVPAIYLRYPPTPCEQSVSAPASLGTYCLTIARCVKHFLEPCHAGMMVEMSMRIPVSFVQKALANPGLRSSGDPKLAEAEAILDHVGRTQTVLSLRGTVGKTYGLADTLDSGAIELDL